MESEGSPVRFPPSSWNDHLQTIRRDHRTNNLCEGWNNQFAWLVGHSHPTKWNCNAALQKDARSSNLAKKNLASIQLFIPLWMQGCSTFVYDIATVIYHGWFFYARAPTTYSYRDGSKKMVLPVFFNFNWINTANWQNIFLQLRLTNCTHCAWNKISLYSHCLWLFCHLYLRNRIQMEDL